VASGISLSAVLYPLVMALIYLLAYDRAMTDLKPKARLFTRNDLKAGANIAASKEQAHYLINVMRLGNGDGVALFNGRDGDWLAAITDAAKKSCGLSPEQQLRPQMEESDVWLAFAPLKKSRTDFIVEKATELGATRLLPVFTEHTNSGRVKTERLAAIAIEASEQCDRMSVPDVAEASQLTDLLDNWPTDRLLLVPDETGGGKELKSILAHAPDSKTGFLIGPEGGFAASELDALDKLPFVRRIGLGPRILRAETAALSALSCYQALAGDWDHQPRFNNGYVFNAHK
jgi:16S rRNA (uracil1498-N3)-methyltransferase